MRIAVTGSIATDHLMTFPGRFADQFVVQPVDCGMPFVARGKRGVQIAGRKRRRAFGHGVGHREITTRCCV